MKKGIIHGYGTGSIRTLQLNLDVVVDSNDCIIGARIPKSEQWKYISNTIQQIHKEARMNNRWWNFLRNEK